MACEIEDDEPIIGIPGCTDPTALNYNTGATINDGSCLYPPIVSGCTDPTAINYNELAEVEDCSCIYLECPDDIYFGEDGIAYYRTYPTSVNTKLALTRPRKLSEDCCTPEVTGQDVTWDGTNCVLTTRIDCPKDIVFVDGVVYYQQSNDAEEDVKPTKQLINNINTRRLPLSEFCCTEEVVGQPVTWDSTYIINNSREPGACLLDNLPEECELTLEDVIYFGDTVVINCFPPPEEEPVEDGDDTGGGLIDPTLGCVDISNTQIYYPQLFNEASEIDEGPYVILYTNDVNVLDLSPGDSIELSNFGQVNYGGNCSTISLDGFTTITEILQNPIGTNTNGVDYAIVLPITPPLNCQSLLIEVSGKICPVGGIDIGGKSVNKFILEDTTKDFNFTKGKEEPVYTEGIVLTYNQNSNLDDCGEQFTNQNITLDPVIFNCTVKNTILELNYSPGNSSCCTGYFQITIVGPNNFYETIQSNQTPQIILPKAGEYVITLDLVLYNCTSSLNIISKTPQSSLSNITAGGISLITKPVLVTNPDIPIITDPCDIEPTDPTICPNLSEICCNTLGANLGWQFIDGVCYWNPPTPVTDIEIGISENDIIVPDSGCTDLNVSLFFYFEKPDDPECETDDVLVNLAFYSGDSMDNGNNFTTTQISNFILSRDGYCNWVQLTSQITGYAGESFKIKLILSNVLECCNYNIFVDDIRVDCVIQDSIVVSNKLDCPGFKLDRVIDNKKSWVYNDGLPINRIFAPSYDADIPWRYTDYLEQSGVYEKHSKLVLNSKEMEITFNMCNTDNCTPSLNIFELLEYKNNFQAFWIKFIEQFVPATTIFVAGEKWCAKAEDICPVYDDCDYDNNFDLGDLGVVDGGGTKPTEPPSDSGGEDVEVPPGKNNPDSDKTGDWGKNDKPNGEPVELPNFIGSFIEDKPSDIPEKLTFIKGELPLLKDGMTTYLSKFSKPQTQVVNE